ncbi:unnamed protein product [Clonostachys rosea]|uniref:2EXR domain-containing protein n=1 Tax=Bionectria ochroleuca TaxID=29856 RepID=A0ABY6TSG1_BIOOC|nr:unnamed protein product [Clonostachys rosea]
MEPNDLEFTKFPQLPADVQTRIWHMAIPSMDDRELQVAVHFQTSVTKHSCHVETGQFCGRHDTCERSVEGSPSAGAVCMTDGYFAISPDFPDPVLPPQELLCTLQLTCREARRVVHKRYPEVIKLYAGKWHPGVRVLTLRCDPAHDTLVIMNATSETGTHAQPNPEEQSSPNISTLTQERHFPQDRQQFNNFRQVLSSFRKCAFRHVDEHYLRRNAFDLPPIGESIVPVKPRDLETLSLRMESREKFYLWLYPGSFPGVEEPTRIELLSVCGQGRCETPSAIDNESIALLISYNTSPRAARYH